jgi:hypothetical protein
MSYQISNLDQRFEQFWTFDWKSPYQLCVVRLWFWSLVVLRMWSPYASCLESYWRELWFGMMCIMWLGWIKLFHETFPFSFQSTNLSFCLNLKAYMHFVECSHCIMVHIWVKFSFPYPTHNEHPFTNVPWNPRRYSK